MGGWTVRGYGGKGGGGGGRGGRGRGRRGGERGRGGGDNINYLVKIITENKVFYFLRNWMFLSASDVCQIPFLTFIFLGLAISFLCLSLSLSPSLSLSLIWNVKLVDMSVRSLITITELYNSKKSLTTPDYFAPYLVNVATKEYYSICLETAFISEEFGMKILMVVTAAEE